MLEKRRTCVTNLRYHLVFTTKYRRSIFNTDEKRQEMKDLLQSIAKNKEIQVVNLEVMPDHVHLLLSFPPKLAASSVVKSLKGTSAREWFKKHPEDKARLYKGHLWTGSFYLGTLGEVSTRVVNEYIQNQMKKR